MFYALRYRQNFIDQAILPSISKGEHPVHLIAQSRVDVNDEHNTAIGFFHPSLDFVLSDLELFVGFCHGAVLVEWAIICIAQRLLGYSIQYSVQFRFGINFQKSNAGITFRIQSDSKRRKILIIKIKRLTV